MDEIIELRHLLHRNAELSGQETVTKQILMDFIKSHTSLQIHDCGKWFYCVKEGTSGYSIAFRAEMDRLPIPETITLPYGSINPGVSHKCGHDGHSAVLCGLRLLLDKKECTDTVYLIFQHAEETGQGARDICGFVREKGIREIYAFHNLNGYPENAIVYRHGLSQPASEGLTITFTGKPSHASNPEEGHNPTQAIAETITYINNDLLKREYEGMVLITIVGIKAGNDDFGVSAGKGCLYLTLRAENQSEMELIDKLLRTKVKELCLRDTLECSFSRSDIFPETRNNEKCLHRVIDCAQTLSLQTIEMNLWRASEDFGSFLQECPGAIFYIGCGEDHPALHTPEYDFNDNIIPAAVKMFYQLMTDR